MRKRVQSSLKYWGPSGSKRFSLPHTLVNNMLYIHTSSKIASFIVSESGPFGMLIKTYRPIEEADRHASLSRLDLELTIPFGILLHAANDVHFDWFVADFPLEQLAKDLRDFGEYFPKSTLGLSSECFEDESDIKDKILRLCSLVDLYPTRLVKNATSAEVVLLSLKNIHTVGDLKQRLRKYAYPWTEITFVSHSESSSRHNDANLDIRDLPWALEYETSIPKTFDKKLIEAEMKANISKWGKVIVDARVSFAPEEDRKANVFYPADGNMKCQMAIILTPTENGYDEFCKTGRVHGIPRRLVLTKTLGSVPIIIQNPKNLACLFSIGGRLVEEEELEQFQKRKAELMKEREKKSFFSFFFKYDHDTAASHIQALVRGFLLRRKITTRMRKELSIANKNI